MQLKQFVEIAETQATEALENKHLNELWVATLSTDKAITALEAMKEGLEALSGSDHFDPSTDIKAIKQTEEQLERFRALRARCEVEYERLNATLPWRPE